MHTIKYIFLFIHNNMLRLKRKWLTLPLLFMFPLIIVGTILFIIGSIFYPEEKNPIHVGLVDLDQSKETQLVSQLIEESTHLGKYIQIHSISEEEAEEAIKKNTISAYIIFPEQFTNNLYQGTSVELPIVGNPRKQIDSLLIREIVESIARHIRASQANILTINHYAKKLGMKEDERADLVLEQFKEFVFYTLGSNQIVNEKEIRNVATSSPVSYFSIGFWFIIGTLWLLVVYNFFYVEEHKRMKDRLKLYGVTSIQRIVANIVVTIIVVYFLSMLLFVGILTLLHVTWGFSDFVRIGLIWLLYSLTLLACLALIETIISSFKLRLLVQSLFAFIGLLLSGAIIPVIYFPIWLQNLISYNFFYEAFYWINQIILQGRIFIDLITLFFITLTFLFSLLGISLWKERV